MGKTNNTRKFPGKHGVRPDRYDYKVKGAGERKAVWEGLTAKQKLQSLDGRLGKGIGAKRQRERLAKAAAQEK